MERITDDVIKRRLSSPHRSSIVQLVLSLFDVFSATLSLASRPPRVALRLLPAPWFAALSLTRRPPRVALLVGRALLLMQVCVVAVFVKV
jgi:hypothetical protein